MINEVQISVAGKADIPGLNVLVNSAYRGDTSRQGWTTEADLLDGIRTTDENLADMMQQPGASILKATNEQKEIIGCVFLQKQAERLYLGMLTVAPQLQGGGLGKQLLLTAEEYAVTHSCSSIIMTVISVRQELIAYYERKGYKNTGETRPFPNDPRFGVPKQPLEFIVMEKVL